MRYAVIDLGTNTFNLLIVEGSENKHYNILFNTKEGVKLGEGGINQKIISQPAFARGISAIDRYIQIIKDLKVDVVRAYATSAIRDSSNGQEFMDTLKQRFDLDVTKITGDTEAEMIYLGVKQTLPFTDKLFLILDLGGGSNEFIVGDYHQIYFKKSVPLGMSRLLDRFRPSDPIIPQEIISVESYLEKELDELLEKICSLKPEVFIGASGSFDSFADLLIENGTVLHKVGDTFHQIPFPTFEYLLYRLINSTRQEREQMTALEPVRRDMIVLASLFVKVVLKKTKLTTIYQSSFSLKEGAIFEMMIN